MKKMSLVDYGSSDEGSDSNGAEDTEMSTNSVSLDVDINRSKPEQQEYPVTSTGANNSSVAKSSSGLKLPAPKFSVKSENKEPRRDRKPSAKLEKLTSFLPPPTEPAPSSSTQADTSKTAGEFVVAGFEVDEDDGEEILAIEDYAPLKKKQKTTMDAEEKPRSVGGMFSLLPPPWKYGMNEAKGSTGKAAVKGKSKQPVKIAVPTAPKADCDEEMDDEHVVKKPRPSKGGSGLSTLLPKPKHSVTVKADNPNRPSAKLTSRPLIPYTLTRKTTSTKETKSTRKNQEEDEHVSDEDEPVSFFTFHEKGKETATESSVEAKAVEYEIRKDESSTSTTLPGEIPRVSKPPQSAPEPNMSSSTDLQGSYYRTVPTGLVEPAAAPDYQGGVSSSSDSLDTQTYYCGQQGAWEQQYEVSSSGQYAGSSTYEQSGYSGATPYYNYNPTDYTESYPTAGVEDQTVAKQEAIDAQKLKRLQGRKNRGEEINIVDISAADQIGDPSAIAIRQRSEEMAPRPSTKKGDMPSTQQRRKHQITYLAFQAKEREHELRQQWATNSQTRRQTQSKYGF